MIEPVPRMRVVRVVGTLSSSTQMYSGSLGTSPKRGFLIRSQRVSADFRSTDGSLWTGRPAIWRIVLHPVNSTRTTIAQARRRVSMRTYDSTRSILRPRLPRESLLLRRARRQDGPAPREQRRAGDRGDPGRVEIEHALTLEQHGDDPPRHLEVPRDARHALGAGQHLLDA